MLAADHSERSAHPEGSTVTAIRNARRRHTTTWRSLSISLVLALIFNLAGLTLPTPASAAPSLTVTAAVTGRPLLGGRATVRVTVRNDGDAKAYDLSIRDVLSSSRVDPQGRVTFVSASDAQGTLPPTTASLGATTGDLTLDFINIRDLEMTESYSLDMVVDLQGDPTWQVGDLVRTTATVSANTLPNGAGATVSGTDTATGKVVPIVITSKRANQSTGVEQATGTGGRRYSYTIDVQNNYVGATQSVVVTDTIPDGVEFLGMLAGPAPDGGFPSRDASTGVTTVRWTLGALAAAQQVTLTYAGGIRYDYFGSNNSGLQRAHDATSGPYGTPILDGTTFTNRASLTGSWLSQPATDAAQASVTGKYLTIAKSGTPSTVGIGTSIGYTLTYSASQYYDILSAPGSIVVTDTLPDGQTYTTGTANPAPVSVVANANGTTDLTWVVGPLAAGASGAITFAATVDNTWQDPPIDGRQVVAGDTMRNDCGVVGTWDDLKNTVRPNGTSRSAASAGFSTGLPAISKQMRDSKTGVWGSTITASVGDTSTVRVRFNTNDGATPIRSDIIMGDIRVTDWLPPGTQLVPGSVATTYSSAGDFVDPKPAVPPALALDTPYNVSVGGLAGEEWYLGDVATIGWWQATFDVRVVDVPAVADGASVTNYWKLTGVNTAGIAYSDRALARIDYVEPRLVLTKTPTSVPSPLVGTSKVGYTTTITNTGNAAARDIVVTDTVPVGMRQTAPSVDGISRDGTPLVAGTDYAVSWDAATGALAIDFQRPGISTALPPGSTLVLRYTATVDPKVGAGATLRNVATVGYNSQADGSGRAVPGTSNVADDNTDAAQVALTPLSIAKSGPAGPYVPGDTYTYRLDVSVPASGTAYWPTIVDTLTRDGLYYVTGSATISTQSGAPLVPASFVATSTPSRGATTTNDITTLTWDLADPIDNSNSAVPYVFRVSFDVRYTGVRDNGTWELFVPTASDVVTNTASVNWSSVPSAIRVTDRSAASGSVVTNIDQPLLSLAKSVISAGPYVGGSNVDYRVVVTNTGWSTAYDVSITDTLPVQVQTTTITSATHSATGNLLPGGIASFVATPTMQVVFAAGVNLAPGQSITMDYRAVLSPFLGAGSTLQNTADVDWSSQPGTVTGERVYNDATPEAGYTADTASRSIGVTSVQIAKTRNPAVATIGDIVTYSVDMTIPANTIAYWPRIEDTIDRDGVAYVPNSSTLTTLSGSPGIPASFGATTAPTAATAAANNTVYTWFLNDNGMIDNSNRAQPYAFRLQFQLRITGLRDNGTDWEFFAPGATDRASDTARIRWSPTPSGTRPATPSLSVVTGSVITDVDQPLIRAAKTVLSSGPYSGGAIVDYQVTLTNPGYSAAYDISLQDILPNEVASAALISATHSVSGSILSSTTADFSALPTATVVFGSGVSLGTAETITLRYQATLKPSVGAGAVMTNTVDADWSTKPGSVTGERVYDDRLPQEAAWTQDTTSTTVRAPLVTFAKGLPVGLSSATIGSVYSYTLTATIPANTTAYQLRITDTVPDGLTVLAPTISPAGAGTLTVSPQVAGATPITWDVGDIANPPNATAVLTIPVRVDNTFNGGALLDGLPVGVDGDAADTIANSGSLQWRTGSSGGSLVTTTSGPVNVGIVEPRLTLTKTAAPTAAGAGDVVTFTSVLRNVGTSPAYDAVWRDVLPAGMRSPVVVSVVHSSAGALAPGVGYTLSSAVPTVTISFDQPGSPAIGPSQTVTITLQATVAGGVRHGASLNDTATAVSYTTLPGVDANERISGPVSATASVAGRSPALVVSKTVVGDAFPQRGDTVHFRVIVRNVGTAPAYAVDLNDLLPAGLSYLSGTSIATWSGGGSSTADPLGLPGPALAWGFGGTAFIAPSETLTVDFFAIVDAGATLGTKVNAAVATAVDGDGSSVPADASTWLPGDTDADDTASASLRVTAPGILVDKVLAPSQDPVVQVGQTVAFLITLTNTGDTTLTTVPLADTYDASRLTFVSASPPQSGVGAGTITWANLGPLAPSATRSVTVTFTAASVPAGALTSDLARSAGVLDEFGDPVLPSEDSADVSITRPAVSVAKTRASGQDGEIQPGQTVTFDITVTNSGDTTLALVPLTDTFDPARLAVATATPAPTGGGASTVSWANLGTLAPGASTAVSLTFTALAPSAGVTTDTATVTGASDVYADTAAPSSASASVRVTSPAVDVRKQLASGQDPAVQPGDNVTFDIGVTNVGDTNLVSVPLTDAWGSAYLNFVSALPPALLSPGSASWTLGPLAPGATTTVTVTFTAVTPPPGLLATDTATVSGALDVFGDTAQDDSATAGVNVGTPRVNVAKVLASGQDPIVQAGEDVTFDITVTNSGDTDLATVPLADTYDAAHMTFVSASPSEDGSTPGTVTWNQLGPLAAGASRTVQVTLRPTSVPPGGSTTDTATVTGAVDTFGDVAASDDATAAVRVTAPGVVVSKLLASGQDPQIQAGQTVTFDLAVTNTGNTTLVTVPLADAWDATYLGFVSATVPALTGLGTASWTLGPLAPGESAYVSVTLLALDAPPGHTTIDTVTSSGAVDVNGDTPPDSSASDSVLITEPSVAIVKSLAVGQDPVVQGGQNVSFDLRVTNSGDTTLTAIPLTDTYDSSALAFVGASTTPDSIAPGSLAWSTVGSLAPGDTTVVTVTFRALTPPSGQVTTDTATVSGATDIYGDGAADRLATGSVRITAPKVTVTKARAAGQDPAVQAGAPVTFDIVVTNSGDTTLTTVPLADSYDPAVLDYTTATPAPDSAGSGSVSWASLGELEPGQTATATVTFTALTNPSGQLTSDVALCSGATDLWGDVTAPSSASADVRVTGPGMVVTKTLASGQDTAIQANQTVTFDITVTNSGDTTATTVPLSDTWDATYLGFDSSSEAAVTGPGVATWSLAPIGPGDSHTVTLTLRAIVAPTGHLTLDTARVSGATDENGDPIGASQDAETIRITRPAVAVGKLLAAGQIDTVLPGDPVLFDITVTNSGDTTLPTVPLSDSYDAAHLSYVSADLPPDATGPNTLSWTNLGPLTPGAAVTIRVRFTADSIPPTGLSSDVARVSGATDENGDVAPDAEASAQIGIARPEVSVSKVLAPGQDPIIQAGQTVAFDIDVVNSGETTLVVVPLADTYDAATLQFVSATVSPNTAVAGALSWVNLGTLAPDASASVRVTFRALAVPSGGVTTDTASSAGASDAYGNVADTASARASVRVTRPAVSITKALASGQDTAIQVGQTVTFVITVTNSGDTPLTTVPLADTWNAANLQFVSASLPAVVGAGSAAWSLGALSPGQSTSVSVTFLALAPPPGATTLDVATVAGATDSNNDRAPDASANRSIDITRPSVNVTKTRTAPSGATAHLGQTVTYAITVTNSGDTPLASIPVTDVFQASVLAFASSSPSPASSASGSLSWVLMGPLAPGASAVITANFTALAPSAGRPSTDTVTVSDARDTNGDPAPPASASAAVTVAEPSVRVDKRPAAGQLSAVTVGSTVSYDILVTNSGDTTLSTVPLADAFDADALAFVSATPAPEPLLQTGVVTWADLTGAGELPPGATVTASVTLRTLRPADPLTDVATVSGATDVFGITARSVTDTDTVVASYDPALLLVTKTADPPAGTIVLPGDVITYTVSYRNTTPVTIPDVVITDALEPSVDYVSGSLSSGGTSLTEGADDDAGSFDAATRAVRVELGEVPPGANGSIAFAVRVGPEEVSARGVVNLAAFHSREATIATAGPIYHSVDPIAIIKTGRDVNGGRLRGGDVIEWTITVTNTGLTRTTHVVITDTVPSQTTYVPDSITGTGADDSGAPDLVWRIGTLQIGGRAVVTFRSTVKKGLPDKTLIRNQAVVDSDQSMPKSSDNPETATADDPTIVLARTSGTETTRLAIALALFLLGVGLLVPRRRIRPTPAPPSGPSATPRAPLNTERPRPQYRPRERRRR